MTVARVAFVALLAVLPLVATAGGDAARLEAYARLGPAPRDVHGFRNLDPEFRRASPWRRARFYALGLYALLNGERRVAPLPAVPSTVSARPPAAGVATVTWIGHSTLLIQLDGVSILTDPTWSDRVGPWSGTVGVGRYTPPGVAFDDLPPIDVVLISHDHYDHLDEPTVRRLAARFRPRFVVPLGLKAWLEDRDVTNVVELDWGAHTSWRGLTIVCAPAQHGSGRSLADQARRLWASWVVVGSKRFYFGGDTGYAAHFERIGEALGPFDLAALPIGSYSPPQIARPVHVSPEEALQAWQDLRATRFVAIHWGTFALARERYDEPPKRLARAVARRGIDRDAVWVLAPGETRRW
jgi:L-ascorbate metabolism protein UlaG (beta-lactamase superfamily)